MTSSASPPPTVQGICVARDEWPLVGAAVAHALAHHVDAVCVIDHCSTDGTRAGLERMREFFGPRLRVLRFDEDAFLQEAITAAAVEATADLAHGWLYPFDADEFLLAPDGRGADRGLRAVLAEVPPEVDAIRYAMVHHVAPHDFDPADPRGLFRFRWRVDHAKGSLPPLETLMSDIERGARTLFDIPFLPKVVARRRPGGWIGAGNHRLWGGPEIREEIVAATTLSCAHLTYPSQGRLHLRAAIGRDKIRNGFPRDHGWQNQMLARIADAGGLERFWERHSVGPWGPPTLATGATLVEDGTFAESLVKSLALFDEALRADAGRPAAASGGTLSPGILLASLRRALEDAHRLRRTALEQAAELDRLRRAPAATLEAGVAAPVAGPASAAPSTSEPPPRRRYRKLPVHLYHRTRDNWLEFEAMRRQMRRRPRRLDGLFLNTRILADDLGSPCLAHLCDWSLTDIGFHGDLRRQPQTLFLQPRHEILDEFFSLYFPRIARDTRLVLVTGAADLTLPHQTDLRYGPFLGTVHAERFALLRSDPRVVAWYGDNVDANDAGIVPIPCGSAGRYGCGPSGGLRRHRHPMPIGDRPLRALCTHRIRPGPQWDKRRTVSALAVDAWRDFVDVDESIPCDRFFETLGRYAFTLCVTGGGLDASPKAWMAILAGSIPVIERNAMAAAYEELPVVVIDSWEAGSLDPGAMAAWRERLRPHFEDPTLRAKVVERLGLGFWWRLIRAGRRGSTA